MEVGYQTSKRYEDLLKMVNDGVDVIAYIKCNKDENKHSGEICIITELEGFIVAKSENLLYFAYNLEYGRNGFITKCSDYNVEFLPPSIGIQ